MKKSFVFIIALSFVSFQLQAAEVTKLCEVKICNKIERFSLDVFSHLKDSMAEQCFDVILPQSEAVVGKVLSSESRWYQGKFNPTKKSVTKIKSIGHCE